MRLYTSQHRFYCGVDLHATTLYLHVLDHDGHTRFEKNIPDGELATNCDDAVRFRRPEPARLSMPSDFAGEAPSSCGSRSRRQEQPPHGTETILRRTEARRAKSKDTSRVSRRCGRRDLVQPLLRQRPDLA
jgi:hypothetical protein